MGVNMLGYGEIQTDQYGSSSLMDIFDVINKSIAPQMPVLIVLDEFQDIAFIPEAQGLFRQVLQELKEIPVVFLGSKKHILSDLFAKPRAPLANTGEDLEFLPIPYNEYHSYILERFKPKKIKQKNIKIIENPKNEGRANAIKKAIEKSQAIEFYKYNFWIASALVISSIPFDNYFLIRVVGPVQAGLYSAPFKLLTFAYQFGGNFTRVLASRFASFDSDKKARDFAFRAMPFPLIFILGLTILFFISQPLVTLVFGKEYIQATEILQILSIGFIFFFASTIPSSIILYYFGKPKISFVITLIRYVSFVVLLALLVPLYSAKGGAFAFSVSEFFAFLFMSGYVFIKFSKNGH